MNFKRQNIVHVFVLGLAASGVCAVVYTANPIRGGEVVVRTNAYTAVDDSSIVEPRAAGARQPTEEEIRSASITIDPEPRATRNELKAETDPAAYELRAEALADVPIDTAVQHLSPCFRNEYPEMTWLLERSVGQGLSLADVLGRPRDIEWPELDVVTLEVLSWFDREDRQAMGCPITALEARAALNRGEDYETLRDELIFVAPWWMESDVVASLYSLVWETEHAWNEFDGDWRASLILMRARNEWEDRAMIAHDAAWQWTAVVRELCDDLETPSPSWLYDHWELTCDADEETR